MKRNKFKAICEEISRIRRSPQKQRSYEIGKKRQEKMRSFLQDLKDKKIIRDFMEMGDLSFQDVVKGIDFYVVYVDITYKICPLSITGERWLEGHELKHPEIPVICVSEDDTTASMKSKVLEAIKRKNKGS